MPSGSGLLHLTSCLQGLLTSQSYCLYHLYRDTENPENCAELNEAVEWGLLLKL